MMSEQEKSSYEEPGSQEDVVSSLPGSRALTAQPGSKVAPLSFWKTKEYGRFGQICEASRTYGYIVLCIGSRGAGKTRAARQYTHWDLFEPLLKEHSVTFSSEVPLPRAAFYAPRSTVTAKEFEQELGLLRWSLEMMAEYVQSVEQEMAVNLVPIRPAVVDLLIIDEVDRLSSGCLQVLRDVNEQDHLSIVLLGRTTGVDRLAHMYDLASRVGMVHEFGSLDKSEMRTFFEQQLQRQGFSAEKEALEYLFEKTQGNFGQLRFVLNHLDRMLPRSGVSTVSKDAVEQALRLPLNKKNAQHFREKH